VNVDVNVIAPALKLLLGVAGYFPVVPPCFCVCVHVLDVGLHFGVCCRYVDE